LAVPGFQFAVTENCQPKTLTLYRQLTPMKTFSQITFDFAQPAPVPEEQGVKIRIKSVKQAEEPGQAVAPPIKKTKRGRRPLKELELEAENIRVPEDEVLFQKQYYTIGEVAEMFRVNTSLIRTWENEFDIIEPRKNRKGDRHFRPIDIKNLVLIHHLIRQRKYTLEGAKDYIKKNKAAAERFAMIQSLQKLKGFLLEIKASL
jgi:DNA-binding transcriptional MerR regulator